MPFGQRCVAINIYNICKEHFGSRGNLKTNFPAIIADVFPPAYTPDAVERSRPESLYILPNRDAGLKLALSEKPRRQVLSGRGPNHGTHSIQTVIWFSHFKRFTCALYVILQSS